MGMVLGIPLLLSGCGAATPTKPFNPILLVISEHAATGPDFLADGHIESVHDVDYFEILIRRELASVIVMTTGTTDTAGAVQTVDRMEIKEQCEGEEPARPCIFSYDADTAHNADRTYYIRVTGQRGSTGDYVLTVELNEGEGPMYS